MSKKLFAEHGDIVVFKDGVRAKVINNVDFEGKLDLCEIDSGIEMTTAIESRNLYISSEQYHRGLNKSIIVEIVDGGWLYGDKIDSSDKEYTIDELEEGIEYKSTFDNNQYKIEGGILLTKHNVCSYYQISDFSYNYVKQMKFTKVQPPKPPKKYTFDDAKKDCEENGTEYVAFFKGEETKSFMKREILDGEVGVLIVFTSDSIGYYITAHTTWVKKSDLDR